MDVNGRRTLLMATETKILQLWLYFWGFFSGLAVFSDEFWNEPRGWMLKAVKELNIQVYGDSMVLWRKDAGFTSLKGNSKQK